MLFTGDWCPLGNTYYRKLEIYAMKWQNLDVGRYTVAVAPFGGPIAVADNKDETTGGQRTSFNIILYTAAGQGICKMQWNNGELVHMGWSRDEHLVCVQKDGRVFMYTLLGEPLDNAMFTMGSEAQELKVSACQLFTSYTGSTGIAVMTGAGRFYLTNSVQEPRVWRMSELTGHGSQRPSCWCVLSADRGTKIMCCIGADVYLFYQGQQPEQLFHSFDNAVKQYSDIAVSPDQSKVALISENGLVQIASTDLKKVYSEADSGLRRKPEHFMWCGNDAIACYQEESLILIGSSGDTVPYTFTEPTCLGLELDGIRLINGAAHEFLAEVPGVVAEIFSVGSMSPGSLLLEAMKEFKKETFKAYEYIHMLDRNLQEGVEQCINAAGHEYSPKQQKSLLQAASFGKAFCPDMNSDLYVNMCRVLRVLNTVRLLHIGIPLTFAQLETLTIPILLNRLIARRQWPLAVKISEWLHVDPDKGVNRVMAHWASFKIQQRSVTDEEIARIISTKFGANPRVSYVDVARKSAESGRKELALMLLESEPHVQNQIELFMRLGNTEKALQRAVQSYSPQLIYFVILHLRDKLEKKGDLDFILRKFPSAAALYKRYCRQESPKHLHALYVQEDDFYNQALVKVQQAAEASVFDTGVKIDALKEAERLFYHTGLETSARLCDEQGRLLRTQETLEEKLGCAVVDLPMRDTIITLVEHREIGRADSLKKDWKISDKQFWWWKIEGLAKSGQWNEMESFAKAKKSPIGLLPFVEMCVKYDHPADGRRFFAKMKSDEKVNALIKMGQLSEAADVAYEEKDETLLNRVLAHCGPQSRQLTERVTGLKNQLRNEKSK